MAHAMCCCYSLSNPVGEPLQPIPLDHWQDPTNACQYGKREDAYELLVGTELPSTQRYGQSSFRLSFSSGGYLVNAGQPRR